MSKQYTKDQLAAIAAILNQREPWMILARHLTYTDHNSERNLVLNGYNTAAAERACMG